jgi:hypothetical protein
MVAFNLLDKAMTQLKMQRNHFGGLTFSEPSLTATCGNMPTKTNPSQPALAAQALTSRSPLKFKSKVTFAPGLELLGGTHEPWTVLKPAKPILKAHEYAETDNLPHWSERSDALSGADHPMAIASAPSTSTCIKLALPKKRSRQVAFSD